MSTKFLTLSIFSLAMFLCIYCELRPSEVLNSKTVNNIGINKVEKIDVEASINAIGFSLNSMKIDNSKTIKDIENIIGFSSKQKMQTNSLIAENQKKFGATPNNIYTYDDLGILIYEHPLTKKLESIDFEFINNGKYDFSPKSEFTGKVIINNQLFKKGMLIKDIESLDRLKVKNVLPFVYEANYNKYKIIFDFNQLEQLESISIVLNISNESKNSNINGWNDDLIFFTKQTLANQKEIIELSKKEGFDPVKFADCYIEKMSNQFTPQEVNNPIPEIERKLYLIAQKCKEETKK